MMIRWLAVAAAGVWMAQAATAQDCAGLGKLKLEATEITSAAEVSAGDVADAGPMGQGVPATCRVKGVIRPSSDSEIRFEVWMPRAEWNGRFLGVGNGGFAGSISFGQMAAYVKRGFATAGTDAGHEGESTDGTFAYGHPEKVKDFGWRAIHVTRERAREIVKAYYGKAETKAYFDACSDGGREALMEAQRFPEDYDGILAGAPANAWSTMLAAGVKSMQTQLVDPRGWIPPRKLPAIEAAVLAKCDALDGVKDGVVGDPTRCHFEPETLQCKGADANDCLTAQQVRTLKALYAGTEDSSGKKLFPGYSMGDETGWREWVLGEDPGSSLGARFMRNDMRYLVTGDPTLNPLTMNLDEALKLSREKTAADLDSTNADLSKFAARGGKLILYHGWNDAAISPWNTIAYYNEVRTTMGPEKADGFVRLYMVPGMEHCLGGPGASVFGQFGTETAAGPRHGLFDSLQDWVEKDAPDESVAATKLSRQMKPEFTRPLCAFPKVATYQGTGDTNDAKNFACVAPHE